jgi:hypothetical protein
MRNTSRPVNKIDKHLRSQVSTSFAPPAVLPDANGGFTPCPELLTEAEAVRYLRLDAISVENPADSLRYYRRKGLLRATQVGKSVRYRRIELERFLERVTDHNPR